MSKFQSFAFVASVVGAALMTGAASAQTAAPAANVPAASVANAPPTGAPVAKAQKKVKKKAQKKAQKKVTSSVVVVVTNSRSVALSELDATPSGGTLSNTIVSNLAPGKTISATVATVKACVFNLHGAYADGSSTDSTSVDLCKDQNVNLVEWSGDFCDAGATTVSPLPWWGYPLSAQAGEVEGRLWSGKGQNGFGMTGMAVEPVDTWSLKISGTNQLESITGVGEGWTRAAPQQPVRQSRLLFYNRCVDSFANIDAWGTEMVPWTKEDVRMLKGLAPEKTKMTVIARKLKRSVGATHQKAMRLGVTLGGGRRNRR